MIGPDTRDPRRTHVLGAVVAVGATAVGLLLAFQGWRSSLPAFDMLPFIDAAEALLRDGAVPSHGDLSSYGSFSPPGPAWLLVPGMLGFSDPRLFESVGSTFLHLGTVLGLYLLARTYFGRGVAYLAVVLYSLSALGIYFAGTLWPVGHPFFYVWVVFLGCLWALRHDARFLTAAMVLWAVGMYVDMAIAPAVLVLPAVWLVHRPPIRMGQLIIGALLGLLIWFPYIQFTAQRGFADLVSQLRRQSIFPDDYTASWCNSTLNLRFWESAPAAAGMQDMPDGLTAVVARLLANFNETTPVPVWSGCEWTPWRCGLMANFEHGTVATIAAIALLVLTISGLLWAISGPRIRRTFGRPRTTLSPATDRAVDARSVGLSLLVPWAVLLLIAEPDRPERFLWLWPMQLLLFTAFSARSLSGLRHRWRWAALGYPLLIAVVVANPYSLSRIASWVENGWAGAEAAEIQAVDYVANELRAEGRERASIGYQTFVYTFIPAYNIADSRYKVGADLDLMLRHRHGITNNNNCAEGIASDNEYRIVQTAPDPQRWAPRERFDVPPDARFELRSQFGSFQVYRRD